MHKRAKRRLISKIGIIILVLIVTYFVILNFTKTDNKNNSPTPFDSSQYKIYFCPENDCSSLVWQEFYNAQKIDCSVYSITLDWIWDFTGTKDVRIVTDDDQYKLETQNPKAQDSKLKTDNSSNYMHNKFCIFDKNTLLIGSANFTHDSFEKQNNNIILTTDKKLIKQFQKQFEELWKGNFNNGSAENNVCFSPNNCISFYLKETKKAQKSIKCMFFSFTYKELAEELVKKSKAGVKTEIIMEKFQNSQYSQYDYLMQNKIDVIWDKSPSYMHNKFCVFDGETVITGSMNPTDNGNFNNNESIIILKNKELAQRYEFYFDKYFAIWEGD